MEGNVDDVMNRHTSKQTKLRIKTRYTREASDWRRIQETEDKVWEILWIKNKKFSEYNKAKSRVNETIVACGYGECVVKDSAMCSYEQLKTRFVVTHYCWIFLIGGMILWYGFILCFNKGVQVVSRTMD